MKIKYILKLNDFKTAGQYFFYDIFS